MKNFRDEENADVAHILETEEAGSDCTGNVLDTIEESLNNQPITINIQHSGTEDVDFGVEVHIDTKRDITKIKISDIDLSDDTDVSINGGTVSACKPDETQTTTDMPSCGKLRGCKALKCEIESTIEDKAEECKESQHLAVTPIRESVKADLETLVTDQTSSDKTSQGEEDSEDNVDTTKDQIVKESETQDNLENIKYNVDAANDEERRQTQSQETAETVQTEGSGCIVQ